MRLPLTQPMIQVPLVNTRLFTYVVKKPSHLCMQEYYSRASGMPQKTKASITIATKEDQESQDQAHGANNFSTIFVFDQSDIGDGNESDNQD